MMQSSSPARLYPDRARRIWKDAVGRDEEAKAQGLPAADRRKAHAEVMMAWARLQEAER
jgi:hypothetical protein